MEEGIRSLREVAGCKNSVGDWSGQGQRNIRRQGKERTGESGTDVCEQAHSVKRRASRVSAIQKTAAPEDELSNQVHRVTRLADINQALSSPTLVLAQVAQQQSGLGWRGGSYAWAQQNELLPTLQGWSSCRVYSLPRCCAILQRDQPVTGW